MPFEFGSVVLVPFPFTSQSRRKNLAWPGPTAWVRPPRASPLHLSSTMLKLRAWTASRSRSAGLGRIAVSGTILSEGHLIQPPPDWDISGTWDPAAAARHRIRMNDLSRKGRPVLEIARRMNEMLSAPSCSPTARSTSHGYF